MANGLRVDTGLLTQTSQKAANSADAIIGFFRKMDNDTQNVLRACKGSMFQAMTEALTDLQTQRDRLIPQLQQISEQLNRSGQGMGGQDQGAAGGIKGAASGLSVPPNRPR